jgi:hypothetical protein
MLVCLQLGLAGQLRPDPFARLRQRLVDEHRRDGAALAIVNDGEDRLRKSLDRFA